MMRDRNRGRKLEAAAKAGVVVLKVLVLLVMLEPRKTGGEGEYMQQGRDTLRLCLDYLFPEVIYSQIALLPSKFLILLVFLPNVFHRIH